MNIKAKDKGFTIIEVILVLAIAGLIFMMVFLALPAVQRGQRDNQRKNDLSRAQTAITNFSSSNRGILPTNWATFTTQYLTTAGDSFIDPSGAGSANPTATSYTFTARGTGTQVTLPGSFSVATQNIIYYTTSSTCGTGGATVAAGSRKVSLRIYLEGGGVHCVNN